MILDTLMELFGMTSAVVFRKTLQIGNQLARKIENELVFVITDFHNFTDRKNFLSFGEKKVRLTNHGTRSNKTCF